MRYFRCDDEAGPEDCESIYGPDLEPDDDFSEGTEGGLADGEIDEETAEPERVAPRFAIDSEGRTVRVQP